MRTFSKVEDPVFVPRNYNAFERRLLVWLNDERDLPFIYLCLKIMSTVLPLAILLFLTEGIAWWICGVLFIALVVYFMGPFVLMLHNTSHNSFFKRKYKWANRFIPWVMCPFMGQSPDTYFSHHIGMHHAENNLPPDKSSTMRYQRDSVRGFLEYYFSFLFWGIIELRDYHLLRKKKKLLKKAVLGEAIFLAMCALLMFVNWKATLLVFILPLVIVRFAMMAGNWAQHAFIDPADPENQYKSSITCINTVYNKRCFNDGYHIGHHLRPHLHWTQMPVDFEKNTDKYIENQAVVFEGIDYFVIWWYLMTKNYKKLASHFVNLGDVYKSEEEVIAFLRSRTERMPEGVMAQYVV